MLRTTTTRVSSYLADFAGAEENHRETRNVNSDVEPSESSREAGLIAWNVETIRALRQRKVLQDSFVKIDAG